MQRLAEVRQAGSEVTGQGDVGRAPAAPATDRSEGITVLVWDLLTFEVFEKTSKQVHQADIWGCESDIQERGPSREMNSRTIGIEMVLKASIDNVVKSLGSEGRPRNGAVAKESIRSRECF